MFDKHNFFPATLYLQLVKCHEHVGRRFGSAKTGNHCFPGPTGIVPFAHPISTVYYSTKGNFCEG